MMMRPVFLRKHRQKQYLRNRNFDNSISLNHSPEGTAGLRKCKMITIDLMVYQLLNWCINFYSGAVSRPVTICYFFG